MKYVFYWKTGRREIFEGESPAGALNKAGYGGGAVSALDFYREDTGEEDPYYWDASKKKWMRNFLSGETF